MIGVSIKQLLKMAKPILVTVTPPLGVDHPRANFVESEFNKQIWQKGYNVSFERALQCPCKSKSSGQASNCKNCGGSGWVFVNKTQTRMVIHSMNLQTKFLEWSQENLGTVSITAMAEERLGYMDRLVVLDGESIFWETLFVKEIFNGDESISSSESESSSISDSQGKHHHRQEKDLYYFNTLYPIKEILHIAVFNGTQNKLIPLFYGTDFYYTDNKIIFLTAKKYINPIKGYQDTSITLKYIHAPQFHVIDLNRETMQSPTQFGPLDTEVITNLPVHAIGRRSHYVLDAQDFDATRVLDNSYLFQFSDLNPPMTDC